MFGGVSGVDNFGKWGGRLRILGELDQMICKGQVKDLVDVVMI